MRNVLGRYVTWVDLGAALGPLVGYSMGARFGLEAAYWTAALLLVGSVWVLRRHPAPDTV